MSSNNQVFTEIITKVLLVNETEVSQGFSIEDKEEWDSMSHLVLISEIESSFDLSLSDDEVIEIKSIDDLKQVLRKYSINID